MQTAAAVADQQLEGSSPADQTAAAGESLGSRKRDHQAEWTSHEATGTAAVVAVAGVGFAGEIRAGSELREADQAECLFG